MEIKHCRDCRHFIQYVKAEMLVEQCTIDLVGVNSWTHSISAFDQRKLTGQCGPWALLFEPWTEEELANRAEERRQESERRSNEVKKWMAKRAAKEAEASTDSLMRQMYKWIIR